MPELGTVERTLFIPMLGRIYTSERFPTILYDKKALSLKGKLPHDLQADRTQKQYPMVASAARSANMDRFIQDFLARSPHGAVVQLGCGLETTFYRNDNGHTLWYGVDLPDVIAYRRALLPEPEREVYLAGDAFSSAWIRRIRKDRPEAPLLVTVGGLFHYFPEDKVLHLLRMLQDYGPVELVFDAVNQQGMAMLRKKYMRQVGHAQASMFFYVQNAQALADKAGGPLCVLAEQPYYRSIAKQGLHLATKVSMMVSDRLGMVKMIHLDLQSLSKHSPHENNKP